MQNTLNKEIISRVKDKIKQVTTDNRLVTNKLVYSLLSKWRKLFVERQDANKKILKVGYIYQTLPEEELVEVDKIRSKCSGITANCTIKRLKRPLPELINGYTGPIIRNVASLDGVTDLTPTTRPGYIKKANSPNFKYNKELYYWYEDGYLWFPSLKWDAVLIEGYFEQDIQKFICTDCGEKSPLRCVSRLDEQFFFPSHLLPELEQQVDTELRNMLQVPKDESINKNSNQ